MSVIITLQIILSIYPKGDIYNAEHFGLFYQVLPTKPFYLKDEKGSRDKHIKRRLTCLAASYMNEQKLQMFAVRKPNLPCYFKKLKKPACCYCGQKESWMVSEPIE